MQGVGRRFSNVVCKKANVDISKRAGELSEEEVRVCLIYMHCTGKRGGEEGYEQVGGCRYPCTGVRNAIDVDCSIRPAYSSIFDRISMEISRQYGCTPVFIKIRAQVSRKYGNRNMNKYASSLPVKPIAER